jgi:hypothetical protein
MEFPAVWAFDYQDLDRSVVVVFKIVTVDFENYICKAGRALF